MLQVQYYPFTVFLEYFSVKIVHFSHHFFQFSHKIGAFSENQQDVVAPPQASTSENINKIDSPPAQSKRDEVHLPPPPPPGHSGYSTVKRKDDLDAEANGNLATIGGRPRSVEGLDDLRGARRRRETMEVVIKPRVYKRAAQDMTDVNTSRVIQVVAPGDVNFALNNNNAASNDTVVVQARTVDAETICMSVPSFVGGLVMLLLVLAIASLVAAFLFVRVRHFDRKGMTIPRHGFINEFMKVN